MAIGMQARKARLLIALLWRASTEVDHQPSVRNVQNFGRMCGVDSISHLGFPRVDYVGLCCTNTPSC